MAIKKRIVLVVEDEWLVRMELADALVAEGWEVVEAASGEEAVARLEQRLDFTLLITDIRLEGPTTGWDVAAAFRARFPSSPVIYASGNSPLAERFVSASVFLPKPVMTEDVLEHASRISDASDA